MPHDFVRFPELTLAQMDEFYFESPHKQLMEDFRASVIRVHDGDTITVRIDDRDFDFPIRLAVINAPELSEQGGDTSRDFLKDMIEGQEVDVRIDINNKVEKWGRLLADVFFMGMSLSNLMLSMGMATAFENRHEGKILPLEAYL